MPFARLFPKYKYDGRPRENNIDAYIKYEQEIVIKDILLKILDIEKLKRWNSLAINVFKAYSYTHIGRKRI